MNHKIRHILNAMVSNLEILNAELLRLCRSEQFEPDPVCYELIKRIHLACMGNFDTVRTLERMLARLETRKKNGTANNNSPLEGDS